MRLAAVLLVLAVATPALAQADPQVRGVVRAVRDVNLTTDLTARIQRLPFREGDAFRAGDVIVAFDCERIEAEIRSAEAEDAVNLIAHENAQLLDRRHAIGRVEVQAAKAKWEKAHAAAEALRLRARDCSIAAPFSGRVAELRAREHEMPAAGQPLMRIVDAAALEIDLIVPSAWLAWMKAGTAFQVRLDETGRSYGAKIIRMAAAVDSVSQTIRITGAFTDGDVSAVLPGMSLDATFARQGF